ncbi:MAG: nitronate monooxygenase [Rhodospirillaceae bacterium]|jgi:NAD(P)H-dependent flavin oxidoreductase YrpB (nitropropane dioxygenase family)|nr:nitronate monooxygenase [Rhodospirillaceae bacterium]MBT4690705.1 nitronate monooxygenase [Rhodospirillaceae bacterium]MBT5079113.1 nitronate monooxygenase [Rhodospirillaceae bacterium]MBT5522769.1 nitronate monooxygenase [Rhodospirillaceae bacterium]MBT5878965.1 nitronate monooxygenase [Rhodospirillaceae bacterium]
MQTRIRDRLGFDTPIFAFSHCRDVIVEVTKAGGYGVLGASTYSPEQLEIELAWIDAHVGDRPYGVDVIIPVKYDREAEAEFGKIDLHDLIPTAHKTFMEGLLAAEGVPELPDDERQRINHEIIVGRGAMTPDGARRLLDVVLKHPKIRLVVSALGAPPADVVETLKAKDIMVGALCGKPKHAVRQRDAGVEFVVAQGTEAGGHTGDISTLVLVPQVIDAVNDEIPVLAAGGFARGKQIAAALALGAEGVWCGTVWLGTQESELTQFEKEAYFSARTEDAVRRRCRTGKTVRMLKSKLSEAWEQPDAPDYLDPPLQGILFNEMTARVVRAERPDLYSFPAGQVVGTMTAETTVRQVMYDMQLELVETLEGLSPSILQGN